MLKMEEKPETVSHGLIPTVIGFAGKFHCGKDSAAQMIIEYLSSKGISHQHLKFADRLKKVISDITDVPLAELYTTEGKSKLVPELNQTTGKLHQTIGQLLKQIHPAIWVFPVSKQFNKHTVTVISDVRFMEEVAAVKEAGGIVIKIDRHRSEDVIRETGRDEKHISEIDLDNYDGFDTIIENNGTLDDLRRNLFKFLKFNLIRVKYSSLDKENKWVENDWKFENCDESSLIIMPSKFKDCSLVIPHAGMEHNGIEDIFPSLTIVGILGRFSSGVDIYKPPNATNGPISFNIGKRVICNCYPSDFTKDYSAISNEKEEVLKRFIVFFPDYPEENFENNSWSYFSIFPKGGLSIPTTSEIVVEHNPTGVSKEKGEFFLVCKLEKEEHLTATAVNGVRYKNINGRVMPIPIGSSHVSKVNHEDDEHKVIIHSKN